MAAIPQSAKKIRPFHNIDAVVAPTVSDDQTLGWNYGSMWTNTATGIVYVCTNPATGAAVWSQIAPQTGGFNKSQATVDFGAATVFPEANAARTTVAAAWVGSGTVFTASVVNDGTDHGGTDGGGAANPSAEDAAIEGIQASVTNVVPGISFDVVAYAPNGTWGRYLVNVFAI